MSESLNRFLLAQSNFYETAIIELRRAKKISHWMWFIFPQVQGLGKSALSNEFSLKSTQEAQDYLNHNILFPRLIKATNILVYTENKTINDIFDFPDDLKLKSSMTLFSTLTKNNDSFHKVLIKYFDGITCEKTKLWLKYH